MSYEYDYPDDTPTRLPPSFPRSVARLRAPPGGNCQPMSAKPASSAYGRNGKQRVGIILEHQNRFKEHNSIMENITAVSKKAKYPGWRTMTGAQRYNAKADRIWEAARNVPTRFNDTSRWPENELIAELLQALKGVVSVADRKTDEFDRARAAISKAEAETCKISG